MTLPFYVYSNVHTGGRGRTERVGEPVRLHVDRYFSYESIQSNEEKISVYVAIKQRFPEFRMYDTALMARAPRSPGFPSSRLPRARSASFMSGFRGR